MTDRGPIIFLDSFEHNEFKQFNPSSAGFVDLHAMPSGYGAKISVTVYGESIGLKLEPDSDDQKIIERILDNK